MTVRGRFGFKAKAAGLLVAFALLCGISTVARDFWYPDEPDMADITGAMLRSGDILRLTFCGESFADYPPLFFWAASISGLLFGVQEAALRLPSVVSSLVILVLVLAWGRRRLGETAALWSAAVLASTFFFVWQAVNMQLDMMFAMWIAAAVLVFDLARDEATGCPPWRAAALSGVLMGMASLTKGPAGIVLPAAVLGAAMVVSGRRGARARETARVAAAFAVGLGVFAAWAGVYAALRGGGDIRYFVLRQNAGRFLTGWSHGQPWYYYFVNLWPDLVPWSFFLPFAAVWAVRERKRNPALTLCLVWFAVVFLLFTVSRSKRHEYVLPLYPAAAVIIGSFVAASRDRDDSPDVTPSRRLWWGAVCPILVIAAVMAPAAVVATARGIDVFDCRRLMYPGGALALASAAVAVLLWVFGGRRDIRRSAATLAVGFALLYAIVLGWLFPMLDPALSAKDEARWLSHRLRDTPVAFFRVRPGNSKIGSALSFYGDIRTETVRDAAEIDGYFGRHGEGLVIVEQGDLHALRAEGVRSWLVERRFQVGKGDFVALAEP